MNDNKLLYGALIGHTTTNNFITMAGIYYIDSTVPFNKCNDSESIGRGCASMDSMDNPLPNDEPYLPNNEYELEAAINDILVISDIRDLSISLDDSVDGIDLEGLVDSSESIDREESLDGIDREESLDGIDREGSVDSLDGIDREESLDGMGIIDREGSTDDSLDGIDREGSTDSMERSVDEAESIDREGLVDGAEGSIDSMESIETKYVERSRPHSYKDVHQLLKSRGYVVADNFMEHLMRELCSIVVVRGRYQENNIKFIDDILELNIQRIIKHLKFIIFMDDRILIDYSVYINIEGYKMVDRSDYKYTILINLDELGDIMVDNHIHEKSRICIINNTRGINFLKKDTMMVINLERANNLI